MPYYINWLEGNNAKGVLAITDNFHLLDVYLNILKDLDNSPFKAIIILSEKYHQIKGNFYCKFKYRKYSLHRIKKLFLQYSINEVITSNDGPLLHQYALHLNSSGKNTYLEDGMFNYLQSNKQHSWWGRHIRSPLHNRLYKRIYFKEWLPNLGVGNNPNTSELYLTHPEHSLYHPNMPVHKLQIQYFLQQNEFILTLLTSLKISNKTLANLNCILLLDYHGRKESKLRLAYQENLINLCQKLSKKNLNIGVKAHPRDSSDYSLIRNLSGVSFLPTIAFEFLLPFIKKETVIIGGFSTSIMLAKALSYSDVRFINSTNFSGDYQAQELFKKLGIDNFNAK